MENNRQSWSGRIIAVQPRIRLARALDERYFMVTKRGYLSRYSFWPKAEEAMARKTAP